MLWWEDCIIDTLESRFSVHTRILQIDAKACNLRRERLAAFGEEGRHLLGGGDIRIVFEVDERARERARDFAPFLEPTDAVAHWGYMG